MTVASLYFQQQKNKEDYFHISGLSRFTVLHVLCVKLSKLFKCTYFLHIHVLANTAALWNMILLFGF